MAPKAPETIPAQSPKTTKNLLNLFEFTGIFAWTTILLTDRITSIVRPQQAGWL
jgi:hypothetical protein